MLFHCKEREEERKDKEEVLGRLVGLAFRRSLSCSSPQLLRAACFALASCYFLLLSQDLLAAGDTGAPSTWGGWVGGWGSFRARSVLPKQYFRNMRISIRARCFWWSQRQMKPSAVFCLLVREHIFYSDVPCAHLSFPSGLSTPGGPRSQKGKGCVHIAIASCRTSSFSLLETPAFILK